MFMAFNTPSPRLVDHDKSATLSLQMHRPAESMSAGKKTALPENNRRDQHEGIQDNPFTVLDSRPGINFDGRVAGVNVPQLSGSEKRIVPAHGDSEGQRSEFRSP